MTFIKRTFFLLAVLLVVALAYTILTAAGGERPVAFQLVQASDGSGEQFAMGIWYPTVGRPMPTTLIGTTLIKVVKGGPIAGNNMPLVVISHGNGAGIAAHIDLALALASNGYVVAAPMHSGDNFQDQSGIGSEGFFHKRLQQYRAASDYMLHEWVGRTHVDAENVGAFGMSMGGFTVQTAIGAQPDLRRIATHCAAKPEFACDVLAHFKSPYVGNAPREGAPFAADSRIRAAVLAAPGMGFTMTTNSLEAVNVPVQLWTAEKDENVPDPGPVRELGKGLVEHHAVAGARHLTFLAPCRGLLRPPELCAEAGDFDRAAFHTTMNASVVAFFDKHLKGQ